MIPVLSNTTFNLFAIYVPVRRLPHSLSFQPTVTASLFLNLLTLMTMIRLIARHLLHLIMPTRRMSLITILARPKVASSIPLRDMETLPIVAGDVCFRCVVAGVVFEPSGSAVAFEVWLGAVG